jgi:hypothetical protein
MERHHDTVHRFSGLVLACPGRWGEPMNKSTTFLLSFSFTMVGAALDYLVGRLADSPSVGIAGGAVGMAIAAVVLDFFREGRREEREIVVSGGRYTTSLTVTRLHELHRGADAFRWGTMINAVFAAALAWAAAYTFILAILTLRFTDVLNGRMLGGSSPYDNSVVTFIGGLQMSSAMLWFALACFFLAVIIRPSSVVPLSVIAVSVANTVAVPLGHVSAHAPGPRSQLMQSVTLPDERFFLLPGALIVPACLGALFAGLLVCGLIHLILVPRSASR